MLGVRTAVVIAAAALLAGCSSSGAHDSSSFASKIQRNGAALAEDTSALVVEVFAAAQAGDDSALYTISHDAHQLHDHLTSFRDDVLVSADLGDNDQSLVVDGQDEITKGVGTIIRWCDNPSPSLTDLWESQLVKGIGEWNAGIRAVWRKAKLTGPPVVKLPAS
jgi:outer membrane murein-binding lipoprotein Lpp